MKKGISKKSSGTEFPSNYRTITETSISILAIFSIISLVFFILFLSARLYQDYQTYAQISSQRQQLSGKINYWSSILDKFPEYSDASFNLAILNFQLNSLQKARSYMEKTLIFDPNYPQADKLEKELEKRGF